MKTSNLKGNVYFFSAVALMVGIIVGFPFKSEKPKRLEVNGTAFIFPKDFKVQARPVLKDLLFRISPTTLDQNYSSTKRDDLVEVTVLPANAHPGSFYLRESAISKDCKNRENSRLCTYQKNSKNDGLDEYYRIYYNGDKPFLVSVCRKDSKGILKSYCNDWSYLTNDLKISYFYPYSYKETILEMDEAVKLMLTKFKTDL